MELTRCSNGHFYDAERFSSCPYCNGAGAQNFTETVPYSEGMDATLPLSDLMEETLPLSEVMEKTVPQSQPAPVADTLTGMVQEATQQDNDKTISIYDSMMGTAKPVVGWLVCIEGVHCGEDFRLTAGRNFIGRSRDMDVALTGDNTISRERHAVILYEPRGNVFLIQPGDSKELSYLNDKVVLQAEVISAYDVLQVGESKLMFIPFCGEKYKWEEKKKDE